MTNLSLKPPQILDCTLRDGGLVNDSNFSDEFATAIVDACERSGIDIVEVGFYNSSEFFAPSKFGKWRFCKESALRKVFGDTPRKTKLCVLTDAGKCDISSLPPRDKSIVSSVRCAFYAENISAAVEILNAASELGYETSACMMAVPQIDTDTRHRKLDMLASTKIDTIYLMDSFGTLTPYSTAKLCKIYAQICRDCGKTFAAHFHNNLQCAFANSLAAWENGAQRIDSTIGGLGKGSGNCPTELLAGFFRSPDFCIPLVEVAEKFVKPIKSQFKCGFYPQYMLSALLKKHPRPAIEYSSKKNPETISEFYKNLAKQTK